jgi:transposase
MQGGLFIGADVSKAEIVYGVQGQQAGRVANDAASLTGWLQQWPAGSCIAMESTGRYHLLLASLAYRAGLTVYVLNPKDVRRYRESLGVRGKTDRLDADTIAQMLAERHSKGSWHGWTPGTAQQQELDAMLRRRATLAVHRCAIVQTLEDVAEVAAQWHEAKLALDALMDALDQQILQRVQADERIAESYRRLHTITGIGPQTAALLANLLTRIPFANADAFVAFSGLDPRPNDSGPRRGRRRITKRGPPQMRRLIFLAAQAAARSKVLRPLYEAIRARGFSTTQALVILARKLLRVAFSIYKTGQSFDASRLLPRAMNA